jgi:hypothetical protein
MGFFGKLLGGLAGSLGSALLPIPGANGKQIGEHIGSMLPFQHGGMVTNPSAKVFNQNQMVVRKPKKTYQKSTRKSRKKK